MIKFKSNGNKYQIPSSWSEVTYNQWEKLSKTEKDIEIMAILSGMPKEMLKRLDDKSFYKLSLGLSFIGTKLEMDKYEAPENLVVPINKKTIKVKLIEDINTGTFGQKIALHKLLNDNSDDIFSYLIDIILVYSQPQIDGSEFNENRFDELRPSFKDLFLVDLYSTAISYIKQLKKVIEKEEKHLKSEPTNEQLQANIEVFDKFGVMNTIRALAGDDILKYNEVTKIEYGLVFTHMVMSKEKSEFSDRYGSIMRAKAESEARSKPRRRRR